MASMLQNDPSLVEKLDSTPGASLAEKLKTFLQKQDGKKKRPTATATAITTNNAAGYEQFADEEEEEAAAAAAAEEEEDEGADEESAAAAEMEETPLSERPRRQQPQRQKNPTTTAEDERGVGKGEEAATSSQPSTNEGVPSTDPWDAESFPHEDDDDDDHDEDFQMDDDDEIDENDESLEELMRKVKAQKDKAKEKQQQQQQFGGAPTAASKLPSQRQPRLNQPFSARNPFVGEGSSSVKTVKVKPMSHVAPSSSSSTTSGMPSLNRPFLGGMGVSVGGGGSSSASSSSTSTTFSQLKQIALSLQNDPAVASQLASGPTAGSLKEQLQHMARQAQTGNNPGALKLAGKLFWRFSKLP